MTFFRVAMACPGLPAAGKVLGKRRSLANGGAFPIEDIDRDGDKKRNAGKDCGWPFKDILGSDVLIH